MLSVIQQEVDKIGKERDQIPIFKFNQLISQEIKGQPAPFIYERLGEKYRHYFIDEFQDTSTLQWSNLVPLVDNALASEGGSLFLVGDAKQAIYRWRGGRAEQLLDLKNEKKNPFVVQPLTEELLKITEATKKLSNSTMIFSHGQVLSSKTRITKIYSLRETSKSPTQKKGDWYKSTLLKKSLKKI